LRWLAPTLRRDWEAKKVLTEERVYVEHVARGSSPRAALERALDWTAWSDLAGPEARIYIKPNFTYPFYKPGVTTSPKMLDALVSLLAGRVGKVAICEGDGGSRAWTAEEAFAGHDCPALAEKYGVKLVNLSAVPAETVTLDVAGREVALELPSCLIHECDLLVTVPVPKVHVMTGVSLAFKNQWGCIPDVMRLRHHPEFPWKVLAVCQAVKARVAIFDGEYFLNRTGPMDGEPVRKNLLIASNSLGAGSLACCRIMAIDPHRIRHFRVARKAGMFPASWDSVIANVDPADFAEGSFHVERTLLNWVALAGFRSGIGTYIGYIGPTAKPLHALLYMVRGRPADYRAGY